MPACAHTHTHYSYLCDAHTHAHMHTHFFLPLRKHTFTFSFTDTRRNVLYNPLVGAHADIYVLTNLCLQTNAQTHTHTHRDTHRHTHTHTHNSPLPRSWYGFLPYKQGSIFVHAGWRVLRLIAIFPHGRPLPYATLRECPFEI